MPIALGMADAAGRATVSASAMPESVRLDTSALSHLSDRIVQCAAELAAVAIGGVEGLPGSALAGLAAPGRTAADVRRLATVVDGWAVAARRAAAGLATADGSGADRLEPG